MVILDFLLVPANIESLKEGLSRVSVVKCKLRHQDEREKRNCICNYYKHEILWPSLTCHLGAGILDLIAHPKIKKKHVPVVMELEFVNDDYCDWAYVVDLDTGVFEVFAGCQPKNKAVSQRFNDIGGDQSTVPVLVKSFPFSELPTTMDEFIDALHRSMDDSEEHDREEREKMVHAGEDEATMTKRSLPRSI